MSKKIKRVGIILCAVCMLSQSVWAADLTAHTSKGGILVNSQKVETTKPVVQIDGSTYVALKDLGSLLGIEVSWDGPNKTVNVDTSMGIKAPSVTPKDYLSFGDKFSRHTEDDAYGKELRLEPGTPYASLTFTEAGYINQNEVYMKFVGKNEADTVNGFGLSNLDFDVYDDQGRLLTYNFLNKMNRSMDARDVGQEGDGALVYSLQGKTSYLTVKYKRHLMVTGQKDSNYVAVFRLPLAQPGESTYIANTTDSLIKVNGEVAKTTKPVVQISGSTYVGLKDLGELLGVGVNWNGMTKQVEIAIED